MSINNALRGMMMGLAVGDALGASVEFMVKDSFPPVTGYRDGGPHNLRAGYWTDDTSMALCTAVSLIQKNKTDLAHQMQLYLQWYEKGYLSSTGTCFDIGTQTRRALMLLKMGTPFNEAFPQLKNTTSNAGNGALMRLAPIVIKFHDNTRAALEAAGLNTQLTHPDIRCVHANKVFTLLMLQAMQVKRKDQLINMGEIRKRLKRINPEVLDVLMFDYFNADRKKIPNSGYVINSMKAALWAFFNSSDFKEGALLAVNLGGDSDTIGAIYGQLAGGYDRIPREWIEQLHDYNTVNGYTDLLIGGILESDIDQLAGSRRVELPPPLSEIKFTEACRTGIANRYSWSDLKPMPKNAKFVGLGGLSFTEEEMECIKMGWIPDDMGEKCHMFFEEDTLYAHRSWTGDCQFKARFCRNEIVGVLVNLDILNTSINITDEWLKEETVGWIRALIDRNLRSARRLSS